LRDRAFIAAVAFVGVLAVFILVQNVRESKAPLYGPPTVDKKAVMSKVETGDLSFKEARFYVSEGVARDKDDKVAPAGGEGGADIADPGASGAGEQATDRGDAPKADPSGAGEQTRDNGEERSAARAQDGAR
jgi:hypothetical protein